MKCQIILLSLLFTIVLNYPTFGQTTSEKPKTDKKIKVYLLGTFHFRQTGEKYNVLSEKHQKSILELCEIVKKQQPDKVFVERQPEFENRSKLDSLYKDYTKTEKLISRSEVFQVGFRVAKSLEHEKVYQCDHPGMYGKLYRATAIYAKKNDQMKILEAKTKGTTERVDELINEDSLRAESSLLDYIRWINSEAVMTTSHASYINTYTQVGSTNYYDYYDDNTLIGAELTADWYRRNIMIYAKIINQLDYSENAIFLIIGGDHVPIIRNLFRDNPVFEVIEPEDWLF